MLSPGRSTKSDLTSFKVEVDNPYQSVVIYQDLSRANRFQKKMELGSLAVSLMCVFLLLLYKHLPEHYSISALVLLIILFGAACWLLLHVAIYKKFSVAPTNDPILEITKNGISFRSGEFHLARLQWKHIKRAAALNPPGGTRFLGIIPTDIHLLYGLAQNDKTKTMIDIYLRNDPLTQQPIMNPEELPPISIPEYLLPIQLEDLVTLINKRKAVSTNIERNRSQALYEPEKILEIRVS